MSSVFFLVAAVGLLLLLLWWALRNPYREVAPSERDVASLEESGRRHVTYLPVIRQAMSARDLEFLATRTSGKVVRRAQRERQRIAVLYLEDLRSDFEKLLRLARVIAVLSPKIGTAHELERLRLTVRFSWRYRMIMLGLHTGLLLLPQISRLNQMVSELAVQMESAMRELGERAAVAAELASSLDRRRLDLA